MNKILSVIRLDFYTLKPYQKSIFGMLLIWLILFLVFRSIGILAGIVMISLTLFATYPFSIGERYDLDTLYATLSLKRKDVVIGRYAFAFIIELIGVAAVFILSALPFLNGMENTSFAELAVVICVLYAVSSLVIATQNPIFFKYGYTKSKLFTYLPLILVFLMITLIPILMNNIGINLPALFETAMTNMFVIGVACVVAGLILQTLSCILSCKFYEKRDL
ncbi:ABC-2 transporter permease [Methanolapillus millepedarum]|uniref:ABC-2 transporter permease n=1 Tax=Methanolapillus millepedarum TaxID=3028296 RepID=A0AA96V1V3_9EURY|nr:hypothetical protein MsAc7_04530 [Methanosarcinaceae archaeon Ac7]